MSRDISAVLYNLTWWLYMYVHTKIIGILRSQRVWHHKTTYFLSMRLALRDLKIGVAYYVAPYTCNTKQSNSHSEFSGVIQLMAVTNLVWPSPPPPPSSSHTYPTPTFLQDTLSLKLTLNSQFFHNSSRSCLNLPAAIPPVYTCTVCMTVRWHEGVSPMTYAAHCGPRGKWPRLQSQQPQALLQRIRYR